MSDRLFIDTNVLVYAFDDSEPEKQKAAQELLGSASTAGDFVVSTQVLQELYVALTRGAAPIRSIEEAERAVREASKLIVVQVDALLVLAAIATCRRHLISFWDALIVQAAEAAGCSRLISEDLNAGQALGTVRVENPFASLGAAVTRKPRVSSPKRKPPSGRSR